MLAILLQTATAVAVLGASASAASTGETFMDRAVAAMIALGIVVAGIERAFAAFKANRFAARAVLKAEVAEAWARAAQDRAKSTKEVAVALIEGFEATLNELPPEQAARAKAIAAKAAEHAKKFTEVRQIVREVTHPEEKKELPT